nr:cytochrome P450 [Tanacetum cinerariifolium]
NHVTILNPRGPEFDELYQTLLSFENPTHGCYSFRIILWVSVALSKEYSSVMMEELEFLLGGGGKMRLILVEECSSRQFNRSLGKVCILTNHVDFIKEMIDAPIGNESLPIRISEVEGEIDSLFNGYTLTAYIFYDSGNDNYDGCNNANEDSDDDSSENKPDVAHELGTDVNSSFP